METKQKERIRRLIEILKKTDRIHLKDAARMLEVSVMTIRRDLHQEDEPQTDYVALSSHIPVYQFGLSSTPDAGHH